MASKKSPTDLHTSSAEVIARARTSMIAPAATMVAAWGVRRALVAGYRVTTGGKPPTAQDREASLARVLAWTVLTATAVAVAEVLVVRALTHVTTSDKSE